MGQGHLPSPESFPPKGATTTHPAPHRKHQPGPRLRPRTQKQTPGLPVKWKSTVGKAQYKQQAKSHPRFPPKSREAIRLGSWPRWFLPRDFLDIRRTLLALLALIKCSICSVTRKTGYLSLLGIVLSSDYFWTCQWLGACSARLGVLGLTLPSSDAETYPHPQPPHTHPPTPQHLFA